MGSRLNTGDETLDRMGSRAHWLLRFAMVSVFVFHGVDKFLGSGIAGFATSMDLPWIVAYLVALAELAGGTLILLGAFIGGWVTRLGGLAVLPVLLGAIFMEHWGQWHFMATATHPLGGMQFQVTLMTIALYFAIRGNDT